jgi:hypothetical protein
MSPFQAVSWARELYHLYSHASKENQETLRVFFRRLTLNGAAPLGVMGAEYWWVVVGSGQFPTKEHQTQQQFLDAHTPGGYQVKVVQLKLL